jgi:hypothetical protein
MPEIMTVAEAGRRGGHARAAAMTPEERQQAARAARLARTVKSIVDRAPELTEDQKQAIRAALTSAPEAEEGAAPAA